MLGPTSDAWLSALEGIVEGSSSSPSRLRHRPDERTPHLWSADWTGVPQRVLSCLGREPGLVVLDWQSADGRSGRRRLQEEYLEWRAVRGDDGRLKRVELTTELPEVWTVAAAHEPARLLATVGELAGESTVDSTDVYGDCDPFASSTTPSDRAAGFARTMLNGSSPYNNGLLAICCMIQPTNTAEALVALVRGALEPRTISGADGAAVPCVAAEDVVRVIPELAVAGRASDPVLAERAARLAWDGRIVALDEPFGVFIQGFQHGRLRTPSGDPVPPEWLVLSRGTPGAGAPDGLPRWRRAVLEVPADTGYDLADLVDVATEAPLRFGGQVAELVQIVVHLRVSDSMAMPPEPQPATPTMGPDADRCADVRACLTESLA